MQIGGFQKMTVLDFPGKVACTVFTYGCNFRCPFCHNALLVTEKAGDFISEEELFSFLSKRRGILDGVCITGGEPTLQKELIPFIEKIKLRLSIVWNWQMWKFWCLDRSLSAGWMPLLTRFPM